MLADPQVGSAAMNLFHRLQNQPAARMAALQHHCGSGPRSGAPAYSGGFSLRALARRLENLPWSLAHALNRRCATARRCDVFLRRNDLDQNRSGQSFWRSMVARAHSIIRSRKRV